MDFSGIIKILDFIVMLLVLVLIHEAGHFFAAKKFGIKVEEFGFGFPPRAFSFKKGETIYSINWLPIGGFVKLYGEDEAGGGKVEVRSEKLEVKKDVDRAFYARPVWQRATVVIAGVVMNFILGIAIVSYIFTQGVPMPTGKVAVAQIDPQSPAASVDLRAGDIISEVDGTAVKTVDELQKIVQPKVEENIMLTVERDGQASKIELQTMKVELEDRVIGRIGVVLKDTEIKKYAWYEAPWVGFVESMKLSVLTVSTLAVMLWNWITAGTVPEGVGSPIAVAQLTGQAVDIGLMAYVSLAALLSLNLAILNILPIPALDGGRLFFILLEGITRRKVSQRIEGYAHSIGMIVLLTLMALLIFRDITRLITGAPILPMP